jgi:hypothetical protein
LVSPNKKSGERRLGIATEFLNLLMRRGGNGAGRVPWGEELAIVSANGGGLPKTRVVIVQSDSTLHRAEVWGSHTLVCD